MSFLSLFTTPFLSLSIFLSFSLIAQASVPLSNTFKFVNEGEFGLYGNEYGADYRILNVYNRPFGLCFYNTTPNAFILALVMGTTKADDYTLRWVWQANKHNPVGEKATLAFGSDGNLVLADADGRIVWQTNTANKGVVGLKLLPNGNLVLFDSKGKFVWQSFDHPTDTLLVGQSLRVGAGTKLVSRASMKDNSDGPFSLEMEPNGLVMYYRSKGNPKPFVYFSSSQWFSIEKGHLEYVTLNVLDIFGGDAYELALDYHVAESNTGGTLSLAVPKYNATLSFLRLDYDGNIRFYTYYDKVAVPAWEVTFTLFSKESLVESECQLPDRCGSFGICEDNQCVACPLPAGLMGWNKRCEPVKLTSCAKKDIYYYQLIGVDHFMCKYTQGDGPMRESECFSKCTNDCKCLGFFYHKDKSRCWIAYDLKTLTGGGNVNHVGYIKAPK